MSRTASTSDVFSAIAEPRRRQIIDLLVRRRGLAVGAIVVTLGLPQPAVSKHLGVLREVGLVSVSKQGQHRLYEVNIDRLRPIYDWVKTFEQHWTHQLDRIKDRGAPPQQLAESRQTNSQQSQSRTSRPGRRKGET